MTAPDSRSSPGDRAPGRHPNVGPAAARPWPPSSIQRRPPAPAPAAPTSAPPYPAPMPPTASPTEPPMQPPSVAPPGRLGRWLAGRQRLTAHRAVMAWVGLVLGLLAVPASALPPLGVPVRFGILLAFVCAGPGSAFVCLIRLGDRVSSWAMAFILSLGLAGAVADLMVWTGWWHPVGGYAVLAAPTVVTAAVALLPTWLRVPTVADGLTTAPSARPAVLAAASGSPSLASPDPYATSLLPLVDRANPSATRAALDGTMLLPKIVGRGRLDETIMLPMAPRAGDQTSILPAVAEGSVADLPGNRPRENLRAAGSDQTVFIRRPPVARQPPPDEVLMGTVAASDLDTDTDTDTDTDGGTGRWPGWAPVLRETGIITIILGVWLYSVSQTSTTTANDYGLLSVMNPALYLAIALCVIRFVVELAHTRWRGWVLLCHTILLVVIMHATVPLLIVDPEYAWTYRHIGVTEVFRVYGHITDPNDIYQLWPTFFAFTAHLIAASGIETLRVAAWAPVFFDLAYCLPLFAIVRTLTRDRRVPYLTVFLSQVINWVAQDYFSPQGFTYVLCLGTLLIMLRWLRRTTGPKSDRIPRQVARLWAWVGNGLAEVPYASKGARRSAMTVLFLVFAAVVASHQLSPYLIVMNAGALVVLGLVRPFRIVIGLAVIALAYLIPRYSNVAQYGLLSGFNFFSNAQTNAPLAGASFGRVLSGQVVQFLSLIVWGLAALAVVASRKKLGPVAAPAVLAFTPFGLLLAQSYGGEAIYRVYFFSMPWCAYLIATLVLKSRWLPRGIAVPGTAIVLVAAVVGSLVARHAQLAFNQYTPGEITASSYIYSHAEVNAHIVLASDAFPNRFTANSQQFYLGTSGSSDLLGLDQDDVLDGLKLTDADLPTINELLVDGRPLYLVFGVSMPKYLHFFGYAPDGLYQQLEKTIKGSTSWHIYYQNKDVTIFKYSP